MIKGRHLARATKRDLMSWGHLAFVNRLAIKCFDLSCDPRFPHREGKPTVLLIQPEAYTFKTCGSCGHIHRTLGSRKLFVCPACRYTADHEHNGAFNMLIKALRR